MSDPMAELIQEYQLIPPGSTVLCAVSGGADSIYLLHRLYRLRRTLDFTLAAAHFDHQLRGEESARDMEFVREFVTLCCTRERFLRSDGTTEELPPVELFTGSGDVAARARETGQGVEETARELRYQFLREAARQAGAQWIATAHTANDNGETLLLHLARGTGLNGLCGIVPKRGNLIRPLLTTARDAIEAYLRFWGLPWREDPTNQEDVYARNRLRHRVIPELEALYPGFLQRMSETTARLQADEAYLCAQAATALSRLQHSGDGTLTLPAADVGDLPTPLAVRAARALLSRIHGGDNRCTAAHLEALVSVCRSPVPSAQVSLPNGWIARREYEALILTQEKPLPLPTTLLTLPGQTTIGRWTILCAAETYQGQEQAPWNFYLSRDAVSALTARSRAAGDQLTLPGRPRKSLKKWYIDQKIPRSLRDQLPVLESEGQLAGAAGLGPDVQFLPRRGEPAWRICFHSL